METAMRNVSINDRTTPSRSPIIKTEPSTLQAEHLIQDQPIDFSTKVRVHNIIDSADDSSLRKVSNDSAIDCSNDAIEDNGSAASELAVDEQSQSFPSQPRFPPSSMAMPNISTFLSQSSPSMPGMGMFCPAPPVFPNFLPPGFNPGFTPGPMWPNPMAAMIQQQQEVARKMLSNTSKPISSTTSPGGGLKPPFANKHFFGKQDVPAVGAGSRSLPAMPGFGTPPNLSNIPDPNLLAEALKNHEEMFTAYKQQVLSQKAAEDARKGSRRPAPSTITNGNHSTLSTHTNGASSSAPSESFTLSQIDENQAYSSPQPPTAVTTSTDSKSADNGCKSGDGETASSSSSEDDKHSGNGGSVGDSGVVTNENGHASTTTGSTGPSLHSSDESLQTNDSRTLSHTPAYLGNGENDITGMRPRSMTLPTQSDNRLMSHSPSPSVLSTGNNSSGPGTPNSKNDRGFRKRARTLPDDQKDEAYWERRRKNNEAAKRSRDSRRAKEDEIAIRAAFLEQENIRLRLELAALKTQTAKLRSELVIFQSPTDQVASSSGLPGDSS